MPAPVRFLVTATLLAAFAALAKEGKAGSRPSRPALKGCTRERAADASVGLEAQVQRCDFGFRKIDFLFEGRSLAIRDSDGDDKRRYTFLPDAAYRKELGRKASPHQVPEHPCGDFGEAPDGIQYFEAQPGSGARKVLFVRVGQDEPLFDEKTLRLLPPW